MKVNDEVVAVPVATVLAGAAFAQSGSQSKVNVEGINQQQAGMLNKQEMDLGNAKGGGKTDVTAKNINQQQAGMLNQQKMSIGNAEGKGSQSKVNDFNISQQQAGMLNQQE